VSETPGQATRVYFQSTPPELTLRYAPQPGAVRYRVRVYAGNTAGQPLLDRMVTGLRCPLDAGLLREGSYTWHASALDAGGREVGGGRLNKLELLYDNSLVSLAIARPKPGDRLEGQEVAVSGVAPLGSRLYVNGRAASLDGKGRFDLRVARASAVVFRLVSKNGSESYWLRRLRGPS